MSSEMRNPPPSDVLGSLPHTRPHRRSDKRATKATPASAPKVDSKPVSAPNAASKPASAPKAKSKPASAPKAKPKQPVRGGARPKLAAVPPAEAPTRVAPTPFYTPAGSGARSRVAAQKASKPAPDEKFDVLGTAIQAAAELAEIGISATARAIRGAVDRLPRP